MNNTGNDGQATDPTKAYAVLYKLPEVRQRLDRLSQQLEQILPAEDSTG